jgi:hypothetical protein
VSGLVEHMVVRVLAGWFSAGARETLTLLAGSFSEKRTSSVLVTDVSFLLRSQAFDEEALGSRVRMSTMRTSQRRVAQSPTGVSSLLL